MGRGIDVGVYSKHPIRSIHSNISLGLPGARVFSRDCAGLADHGAPNDNIQGSPR